MPTFMSIYVIKTSKDDFRVIYKNDILKTEQKFNEKKDVLDYIQSVIPNSDVFKFK